MLLGREQKVGRLRETVAIPAAGSKLPANLKAPPCLFSQPATLRNTQFKATVRFRGMQASKRQRRCGQRGHWGLCQNCCGLPSSLWHSYPSSAPGASFAGDLRSLAGSLEVSPMSVGVSICLSHTPTSLIQKTTS